MRAPEGFDFLSSERAVRRIWPAAIDQGRAPSRR